MLNGRKIALIIFSFLTLLSYSQRTVLKEDRVKLKSEIDSILQSQVDRDKISVILLINRQNCGLSEEGEYYNLSPVRLQVFNAVMKYLSVK